MSPCGLDSERSKEIRHALQTPCSQYKGTQTHPVHPEVLSGTQSSLWTADREQEWKVSGMVVEHGFIGVHSF